MCYHCNYCNYETMDKSSWSRHKKTIKHRKNTQNIIDIESGPDTEDDENKSKITKEYTCEYCSKIFTKSYNLHRHMRICKEKGNIDNEDITTLKSDHKNRDIDIMEEFMKNNNQIMKQIIDKVLVEKDKMINKVLAEKEKVLKASHEAMIKRDKDYEYMKRMLEGAGVIANKSLSALNYSNVYYKDAPKLLPMEKPASVLNQNKDDDEFIERLIYKHGNKTLVRFIGTHIVYYYRKTNPVDQSMWTSDVVRLNYIIKEASKWVVDKKGVKVCENIIKPILLSIRDLLIAYENRWFEFVSKNPDNIEACLKANMRRGVASKIREDIDQDRLTDDINRYIAPYFQMRKDDNNSDSELPLESDSDPTPEIINKRIDKKLEEQAKKYKVPIKKRKTKKKIIVGEDPI